MLRGGGDSNKFSSRTCTEHAQIQAFESLTEAFESPGDSFRLIGEDVENLRQSLVSG